MTLRVLLQIVPFGNEDKAHTIETINISNIGHTPESYPLQYQYIIEHNKYKSGEKDLPMVNHNRQDGAIALVHKALGQLL